MPFEVEVVMVRLPKCVLRTKYDDKEILVLYLIWIIVTSSDENVIYTIVLIIVNMRKVGNLNYVKKLKIMLI